jgi:Uma2 family endonuclease
MSSSDTVLTGWTYQRYLGLDDEERYEIIDGELLMTPAPGILHQRILTRLGIRFVQFVQEAGLGEVFFGPTDVVLSETNVVQPDILFIRDQRIPEIVDERAIRGAPDLAVEILSAHSVLRDRHRKLALYQRTGVPEYWIVDPANRAVEVFSLHEGRYELSSSAAGSGQVASEVLRGFTVELEEIVPA